MKRITANCIIEAGVVVKNGELVFDGRRADVGAGGRTDASDFLHSIYQFAGLNYPRFYKMDHLSKLGWLAAELLLKEGIHPLVKEAFHPKEGVYPKEALHPKEGIYPGNYKAAGIGIVLSNANASLDTDLKYYDTVKEFPSPSLFVYTLPNIMIGEICIRNGFKGENAFFVSERFDADLLVQYVGHLLDNDILQVCICGWVDLLGPAYKAALFLVEKGGGGDGRSGGAEGRDGGDAAAGGADDEGAKALAFTADVLNKIFSGDNRQAND